MDIFERIRKEHQDIADTIQELSKGYDKQLFKGLRLSLTAHMSAEEASLYPALAGHDGAEHSRRGHEEVRNVLRKFGLGEPVDFSSKLATLASAVDAHFRAEEEMLLKIRGSLDQAKVEELSYQFYEIERRIVERAK